MKFTILLLGVLVLNISVVSAQTQNHPLYEREKRVHFGVGIGLNESTLKLNPSSDFYSRKTINGMTDRSFPFISLKPACNIHLGKSERLDLQLVLNFSLTQRNVLFARSDGFVAENIVESAYLGMPVLVKYKSARHGNWRFFLLGGAEYSYDFESKEGSEQDLYNPNIAFRRNNYYCSYGWGFDLYYPFFRFSPQIRVANGLNNVLAPNSDIYTTSLQSVRNRMIYLTFFFG